MVLVDLQVKQLKINKIFYNFIQLFSTSCKTRLGLSRKYTIQRYIGVSQGLCTSVQRQIGVRVPCFVKSHRLDSAFGIFFNIFNYSLNYFSDISKNNLRDNYSIVFKYISYKRTSTVRYSFFNRKYVNTTINKQSTTDNLKSSCVHFVKSFLRHKTKLLTKYHTHSFSDSD